MKIVGIFVAFALCRWFGASCYNGNILSLLRYSPLRGGEVPYLI